MGQRRTTAPAAKPRSSDRPRRTSDVYFQTPTLKIIRNDLFLTESIPANSIDLIVTSPPYNVDIPYATHDDRLAYREYLEFSRRWLRRCRRWLKSDGRLCLNIPLDKNKGGQQSVGADLTTIAKRIGYRYHSTIVWNEGNISRRTAWGSWMSASAPYVIAPVELIVVLYKRDWKRTREGAASDVTRDEFMEWTNGLWTFPGESKKRIGHPAPFPDRASPPVHQAVQLRRRHGSRSVHGQRDDAARRRPEQPHGHRHRAGP